MPAKEQKKRTGGKLIPALCNVLGVLLLLAVIALCIPMVAPTMMGYQTFSMNDSSMEPAVPLGSAIYVEPVEPSLLQEGDIIAYNDGEGVIAHRVSINRTTAEEVVTKGDANEEEDFDPIPYASVLGRVALSIPAMGTFAAILATPIGKIYLLLTMACGAMLHILASRMRSLQRARERMIAEEAAAMGVPGYDSATINRKYQNQHSFGLRHVAAIVLSTVFLFSAGVVGFTLYQYYLSDSLYHDASDRFTSDSEGTKAPISVDFKSLQAKNPDIVGWIYCEDTPINYPVLRGKDNDQYLHTDYTGSYNIDGSIFVDADNSPGFMDSNTIVYGHHMASGAMFAGLEKWADQQYYEDHPVMWLLTPEKDYEVVLFSGHHADAQSSMYDIIKKPGKEMNAFLSEAVAKSDFKETSGVRIDPYGHYVMLSTCAYLFDGDRYVVHGLLVPTTEKKE